MDTSFRDGFQSVFGARVLTQDFMPAVEAAVVEAGLHHQVCITLMDLPEECEEAHTAEFYLDRLNTIIDSGVPYDSVCFKVASGTANPKKVYETFIGARKLLGDDLLLWYHTHDTAGVGIACYLAAMEGGATKDNNLGIDLAKSPVCGGTSQPDIISMWHALKGMEWMIDADVMKVVEAENIFEECMKDYFIPVEAKQVSPTIPLSPMPGGALTANTMMMRDTGTLHLYPRVIKEMTEVVKRGGFATSVTPVSQFYFQQAYANVTQGKWKKITYGYGDMVLGYYGRTPSAPDPEIVKLAEKQLGKKAFDGHPLEILEPGIPKAKKILQEHKLEIMDENIFIAYACGEKGVEFLQGKMKPNIRKNVEETKLMAPPAQIPAKKSTGNYTVTVDGKSFNVTVAEGTGTIQTIAEKPSAPTVVIKGVPIVASMPGAVTHIEAEVGDVVKTGDVILVLEAMKMESPVKAPKDCKIIAIEVSVGDNVKNGDTLVMIE